MDPKGTDETEGGWFLVREAECEDEDEEDDIEELFDKSSESPVSDLVDDAPIEQGNSLALFNQLEAEESERRQQLLKRKYLSPKAVDLSPKLQSMTISPVRQAVKKRLFTPNDSGVALDDSLQNEATNTAEEIQVQVEEGAEEPATAGTGEKAQQMVNDLMRCRNRHATMLARFKEAYDCSFTDLTRTFKSDKTCVADWVLAVFGVWERVYESARITLQKHCEYMQFCHVILNAGSVALMLLRFNTQKSRETVIKLMKSLLSVEDFQILCEPPKLRSVPAALFWFKSAMSNTVFVHGPTPDWIRKQTLVTYQMEVEQSFDLSKMVQWAYDHNIFDESMIAYEYAQIAERDENAAAWLASNSQAKFVRDCAIMVKHYKKAELRKMTMSEFIDRRLADVEDDGDWRQIVAFLRFQNVDFFRFRGALKHFLKGTPKRNCLAFCGPSNTGKSLFCMSLLRLLDGKVLSYANSKSHFWLQPLGECKIALLDDATYPTWIYIDTYLRNALDGNPICLDAKHRAPFQINCPPLLITTNVNIMTDDTFKYLQSRVQVFYFNLDMPLDPDGNPSYSFSDANWKCFFKRYWGHLELEVPEEEANDGETS
uniref:Replication protein E1 n=1 Tax=Firstpapillomavirinae sp. TaxID=2809408 RepID=A0AA51BM31_9PAPI|nr:E1 protein [Firstpapillomavirinae sp.]